MTYTSSTLYTTRQGDIVDQICQAHYSQTEGVTEQVLEANPGLAARGPFLPAGLIVSWPEIAAAPALQPTIRLWD